MSMGVTTPPTRDHPRGNRARTADGRRLDGLPDAAEAVPAANPVVETVPLPSALADTPADGGVDDAEQLEQ
jgi:hypothetical protein